MSTNAPARRPNGAVLILGATVVAGVSGYLVTWVVYRGVGPAQYALFAVFWATLYLVVGGLSGIQQEITRASRRIEVGTRARASRARTFGIVAAALVALVVVASAPLWQGRVFPDAGWALVWPLAVGASSYVLVATLSGSLYGVGQWRSLGLMIATDGLLRILLVGVALVFTHDVVTLAWLVALPFPLAILLLWPVIRGGFVGRSDLDVGYRALTWNVARTVLASISTAVLVSGFPLVLGLFGTDVKAILLGELIFTITLTRAPLIIGVLALQSLLLVRFRDGGSRRATWLTVMGIVAVGVVVLGALGWGFGEPVLGWISGHAVQLDGAFIAVLVVSSGLVAALTVSGAAILAAGHHLPYVISWGVAALATIACMALPGDFLTRVGAALLIGPLTGLAVDAVWLASRALRGSR
jgi:O-antigen/teichoic acid export membrane protein